MLLSNSYESEIPHVLRFCLLAEKINNHYLVNLTIDTRQARSATLRSMVSMVLQYHIDMPCANIEYLYGRNNDITSVSYIIPFSLMQQLITFLLHLSGFTMSRLEIRHVALK